MTRPFDPYQTLGTEPNMRTEFFNTIDGVYPEVSKKQQFVFRKMRTDDDGLIACSCVDVLTHEPDKDTFCPICFGESYLWDESIIDGYKVILGSSTGQAGKERLISPGNVNLVLVSFYLRYNLSINLFPKRTSPDKMVELVMDVDGSITRPYQRERVYRIGTAIDFRADGGKLEYYKLDCYEEQVKFLNGTEG